MKTIIVVLPEDFFTFYKTQRHCSDWVKTVKTSDEKFGQLVVRFHREAQTVGYSISVLNLIATQQDFDLIKAYYEGCKALEGYAWLRYAANPMCMGTKWAYSYSLFKNKECIWGFKIVLISPEGERLEFDETNMENETLNCSRSRIFYIPKHNPYTAALRALVENPSDKRPFPQDDWETVSTPNPPYHA